jgi:hypothetical protein
MGLFNKTAKREREAAEAERLRQEERDREYGGHGLPEYAVRATFPELVK